VRPPPYSSKRRIHLRRFKRKGRLHRRRRLKNPRLLAYKASCSLRASMSLPTQPLPPASVKPPMWVANPHAFNTASRQKGTRMHYFQPTRVLSAPRVDPVLSSLRTLSQKPLQTWCSSSRCECLRWSTDRHLRKR